MFFILGLSSCQLLHVSPVSSEAVLERRGTVVKSSRRWNDIEVQEPSQTLRSNMKGLAEHGVLDEHLERRLIDHYRGDEEVWRVRRERPRPAIKRVFSLSPEDEGQDTRIHLYSEP